MALLHLRVLNEQEAPSAAKEILAGVRQKLGFVPNLLGLMANAPPLLKAYLGLSSIFEESTLSRVEQQLVLLSASVENGCSYCVAAHTVMAGMSHAPEDAVEAVRSGTPISDPRLEALRRFTQEVVASRGYPSQEALDRFLQAGYSQQQALEVLVGVGLKTLSNYANHLMGTPLDGAFQRAQWISSQAAAG